MSLRVFALLFCCTITSFAQTESQDYLQDSLLPLPTNGSKVRTPQPLAPYGSYRIVITSPYSLKPVYYEGQEVYENDIQIDGRSQKALSFDEGADGHISSLEFIFRGSGKPVTIGFGKDHYKELESAQVHVYVENWRQRIWRERFARRWGRGDGSRRRRCLFGSPESVARVERPGRSRPPHRWPTPAWRRRRLPTVTAPQQPHRWPASRRVASATGPP